MNKPDFRKKNELKLKNLPSFYLLTTQFRRG